MSALIKVVLAWLALRRKYLVAAAIPAIALAGHFLGQGPTANITDNAAWYLFLIGEAGALGVYAVGNA